jgi:indolepyruvate ferredoxin oxidoreductase, beta subunit
MRDQNVTNVVFAGLGGQGVLKVSDILADAAFRCGKDVKKSELHGMSQRGGSVSSDVRYGSRVFSPMVPAGEADFLVVLEPTQVDTNRHVLAPDGMLIEPSVFFDEDEGITDIDDLDADEDSPVNRRNLNVALLGVLSAHLDLPEDLLADAVRANLPEKVREQNVAVFAYGRVRAAL